ncbi:MAG: tetratricopeptide repeat protein [Planctomycetota bacterium]|jgi:tetratricopeptide (TPR) repeat protein
MSGKLKFTGLGLLACVLVVSGCTPSKNTSNKKADLLRQIDRRFENPQAHFELGRLYQADGLWAQAEQRYNIALSFDPAQRQAQAAMVKVLAASGDQTKSELTADIYINQVAASAGESLKLALGFQQQGLDDYALRCYKRALRLAPNSAKIHRQIGYYYLSRNQKNQARDYLCRSFNLDHNQPEVAGELGRLGVEIKIPRKRQTDTGKLDKLVDQSRKNPAP